jgi:hypothetical protein
MVVESDEWAVGWILVGLGRFAANRSTKRSERLGTSRSPVSGRGRPDKTRPGTCRASEGQAATVPRLRVQDDSDCNLSVGHGQRVILQAVLSRPELHPVLERPPILRMKVAANRPGA